MLGFSATLLLPKSFYKLFNFKLEGNSEWNITRKSSSWTCLILDPIITVFTMDLIFITIKERIRIHVTSLHGSHSLSHWWVSELIPRLTKIFEYSKNFEAIVFSITNCAFIRNLSPWARSRAEKSHQTFSKYGVGKVPFKIKIFKKTMEPSESAFKGAVAFQFSCKNNCRF